MSNIEVEVLDGGFLPNRAHPTDAGIDFFSPIDFTIWGHDSILIDLRIKMRIPTGWVMVMKEKSSVSTQYNTHIGGGVIDSGYRGVVSVHLFNNGAEHGHFRRGQKIAQGVLVPCCLDTPVQVKSIDDETDRGSGGFGSTGAF